MVVEFFHLRSMPTYLNQTLTCLIPKTHNSVTPNDYRPIGLCNCSYKVISKILVNRLKPLMEKIIAPTQSAYVPQRLNNNIVLAHELIHSMKKSKKKSPQVA